jgi:hypothetical protein
VGFMFPIRTKFPPLQNAFKPVDKASRRDSSGVQPAPVCVRKGRKLTLC